MVRTKLISNLCLTRPASRRCQRTCAVVDQDEFGIRGIIAQHDLKMAALGHIDERARVSFRGVARQGRAGRELPVPISQEDLGCELPMATLHHHDVGIAVAVQVADAGVGRGLGNGLEGNDLKGRHGRESE